MESGQRSDILTLKVMRLTRPSLFTTLPLTCDSQRDLPGDCFNSETRQDVGGISTLNNCSLGELLMLPQSFGDIYLGQVFSSYISVHNDSNEVVHDVTVKADLQTGSQRISLSPTSFNTMIPELTPLQSVDNIINHEVMKPLDVKTKFYNAESDEVFLEAQVQNITSGPICLEKVYLEPSPLFNVTQLNTRGTPNKSESIFGAVNCLNSMDSRQYLYCLTPKIEAKNQEKALKGVTSIGKLDILWRSKFGDKGRLQTSQLQRMAPGYGDIRLAIEELPNCVQLERPFSIVCTITNSCERAVNLVLMLDGTCSPGLYWTGISGKSLGKLEPESCLYIQLNLVPIQLGLQTISGIRLVDTFLKRTYDYDELAQVFVKPQPFIHVN
uniref:Trafficking protein particle complex subunit 13 n=1 Tax=Strigamia maritima TaxID=126957 RepID=T1J8V5_STRMM